MNYLKKPIGRDKKIKIKNLKNQFEKNRKLNIKKIKNSRNKLKIQAQYHNYFLVLEKRKGKKLIGNMRKLNKIK